MKPVDYSRVKNVDDLGFDDILDIISMIKSIDLISKTELID